MATGKIRTLALTAALALVLFLIAMFAWTLQPSSWPQFGGHEASNHEATDRSHALLRFDSSPQHATQEADAGRRRELDLAEVVHAAIARATHDLRKSLQGSSEYAEYARCAAQETPRAPRCRELLGTAVFANWSELQARSDADYYGLGQLVAHYGGLAVAECLADSLMDQPDELARICALTLLERTRRLDLLPLPPAAFAGLSERLAPETLLLLDRHALASSGDARITEQIVGLADRQETPSGLRYAAVRAVGHSEAHRELNHLTRELMGRGLNQQLAERLGESLGRCGVPCRDTIRELAWSDDAVAHVAAARALASMDPSDRRALASAFRGAFARLNAEESAALRRGMEL